MLEELKIKSKLISELTSRIRSLKGSIVLAQEHQDGYWKLQAQNALLQAKVEVALQKYDFNNMKKTLSDTEHLPTTEHFIRS